MSIWDEFEKKDDEGESFYFDFNTIGDTAEGIIVKINRISFDGKKYKPQLTLRTKDGKEKFLTCSGADLIRKLAEIKPKEGDHLSVKFVDTKDVKKPSPMKVFDVVVTPATLMVPNGTQPAPAPAQPLTVVPSPASTEVDPF